MSPGDAGRMAVMPALIMPMGQAESPALDDLYFKPSMRHTQPGLVSATSQKAYTRR
jgi:hypothetical protein